MSTRNTPWPAGTPCWVDYAATDAAAAADFYAQVLGWSWTDPVTEFEYRNALLGDRRAAGLGPAFGGAPAAWTVYFATDDSAATAARIRGSGGAVVVDPMPVGPFGTMTVAADPEAHAFGLWEAGEHTGAEVVGEPGAFVWDEAAVQDVASARAFYTAVFGFAWDDVEGLDGYATFRTDERPLGGLGPVQPGLPEGWAVCFAVASTDETVAAVESRGGKVLHPAEDTEFGRFAVVEDPWGAAFSVMEPAPEG